MPTELPIALPTARMTLRRLTPADVEPLVALDADPEVMRYLTGGMPPPARYPSALRV